MLCRIIETLTGICPTLLTGEMLALDSPIRHSSPKLHSNSTVDTVVSLHMRIHLNNVSMFRLHPWDICSSLFLAYKYSSTVTDVIRNIHQDRVRVILRIFDCFSTTSWRASVIFFRDYWDFGNVSLDVYAM